MFKCIKILFQIKHMKENQLLGYALAFMTVVVWSGWIIISRLGMLTALTPFDVTFLRYTSAGLIMLPVAIKNLHLITKQNWLGILIMVAGAGAPYLMLTSLGFQRAPSSHGILTPSSMPLFIAILSFFILKESVSSLRIVGYLFILAGVIFRFTMAYVLSGGIETADIYFLLAGLSWSIYTVQNKRIGYLSPVVATSFVACGSMIFLAIPYAIYQYEYPHALPLMVTVQQVLYQGVLTSVISLIMFNRAIQIIGASKTSSFTALVPCMVILLGIIILHEMPTNSDLIFVALMSVGVFFASGILSLRKAKVSLIT